MPASYSSEAFAIFNLNETIGSIRNRAWLHFRSKNIQSGLAERIKSLPPQQQSDILDRALSQTKFPPTSWFYTPDSNSICWLTNKTSPSDTYPSFKFLPSSDRLPWELPLSAIFVGRPEATLYLCDCTVLEWAAENKNPDGTPITQVAPVQLVAVRPQETVVQPSLSLAIESKKHDLIDTDVNPAKRQKVST